MAPPPHFAPRPQPARRRDLRAATRTRSRTPRHAGSHPRHIIRAIAVACLGLLTFVIAGSATAWYQLQGNIATPEVDQYLPSDRPTGTDAPIDALSDGDVNILVMGSDSREGDNTGYGTDVEGMRSDSTLLVHIAADRSRVEVISIPRDLIVEVPSCLLPDGSQSPYYSGVRFNSAFSAGAQGGDLGAAAACTIRTFETMSGIYVDDFVIVDFSGFKSMVDAIGGVDLCISEPITDRKANLDLAAGCQTLDGEQALGLARARKNVGVGDGSDISRIDRQQELLRAMAAKAMSADVVANPSTLLSFLGAATSSLTTSERIGNLQTMAGLAYSLRDLDASDLTFATMPFDWSGNVVLQNADSNVLWESILADQPAVLPPPAEVPDATDDGISITPPGESASGQEQEIGQGSNDHDPDAG